MPNSDTNEFPQAKLIELLQQVAEDMIAAEGEFQALDAALGDGDLWSNGKDGVSGDP
jgi:hypothetical protein